MICSHFTNFILLSGSEENHLVVNKRFSLENNKSSTCVAIKPIFVYS